MLPGVDDGAKDLPFALDMARAAVNEGISHILLTPHHMDGDYTNHKKDVLERVSTFQEEITQAQIPLTVFPGQEVHLTGDLLKAIDQDDILYMDEGGRYLLLELPHSGVPEYTEDIIFELRTRGITPVIAHPERNHGFQKNPNKIYDFVEMGCLMQLTSSSYLGIFGKDIETLTSKIIDANLGCAFASDAHNFKGRRFVMQEAFRKLEREKGDFFAEQFNNNAKSIINGDPVERGEIQKISTRKKFWFF
ncbi:tyrosine protein phosphatase [Levilactobacillus spicheri]|uniref:Tyrosine-protein phosphatase n=2 Tax=Levilactobacillus spicheri TaxID=216463 RepID=A0A0F3RQ61_9LACO|nr:tyrosine protein phosphatase [Levilactobacillus spicheri]